MITMIKMTNIGQLFSRRCSGNDDSLVTMPGSKDLSIQRVFYMRRSVKLRCAVCNVISSHLSARVHACQPRCTRVYIQLRYFRKAIPVSVPSVDTINRCAHSGADVYEDLQN